jgi:iron complex outermembrane recepter protein
MNRSRLLVSAALVSLFVVFVTPMRASSQAPTGTLSGIVIDQANAVIPDVAILVVDSGTALTRETKTDADGAFAFPLLPSGTYTLRATHEGFMPFEVPSVALNGAPVVLRVQLKVESFNEAVVVTAQKRGEERVQDVPVPVTVLDARQLSDLNKTRARDFFDLVPGFNGAPASFGRAALSIRGVSPLGGAPTVGVVIDDIPFGLSGGAQAGIIPEIDPGDLARIEVLRGPQGSLYGAGSMGGLLKYATADPSGDRITGRLQTGTSHTYNGSAPGLNLRGSINLPVSKTLAMRANGFVRQDSGYIDNPVRGLDGVNQSRVFGGRISARWQPSRETSLLVGALYQDFKRNGLDEETMETPGFPQTIGLGPLDQNYVSGTGDDHIRIQHYSAIFKTKLRAFDLTSLTGYNHLNVNWSVDLVHLFDPAVVASLYPGEQTVLLPYFEKDRQHKFSQELRVHKALGRSADVVLGGFYTHEASPAGFNVPGQSPDGRSLGLFWRHDQPDSTLDEYAAFGNLSLKLTKKVSLELGARQSNFEQHLGATTTIGALVGPTPDIGNPLSGAEDAFTYLVTPQVKVTDEVMVYARFASGYRPTRPNTQLEGIPRQSKPDETQNYEVGLKAVLPSLRLMLDTSIYHIDWKDIQLSFRVPVTQFVYVGNAGAARSDGVELATTWEPTSRLSFRGTFSFANARLSEDFPATSDYAGRAGDRLPFTSKTAGALSVEQAFPLSIGKAFIGGTVSYVGDRKGIFIASPDRQDLPAYGRLDLQAGVQHVDWTLTAYANNVTNERGILNGGRGYFFPPARIYITPRLIGLTITKSF